MQKIIFTSFYRLYLKQVIFEISHYIEGSRYNIYVNLDGICQSVTQLLHTACSRAIMIEFHVCDQTNKLKGESLEEKLAYYEERFLCNDSYRDELFQIYPELFAVCERIVKQQICRFVEFWDRFCRDKNLLESELLESEEIKYINDISLGEGDLHCGGKGVISATFDNGTRVFYKPHSLDGDSIFYKLLDDIEASWSGVKSKYMHLYRFIPREDYGWVKAIDYCSCVSEKEYRYFYKRMGVIIGICYFLGTHDLHYQNLIAHGEYPIIIDLENIFQTEKKIFQVGERKLEYSVLYSGLLPGSMRECKFAALTGGRGDKAECEVPMMCAENGTISIKYGIPDLDNGLNLPGKNVRFADYLDEIRWGLQTAYSYIKNMSPDKLNEIVAKNVKSRYLLKKTQVYFNILMASFHPKVMRQSNGRENFIRKICEKGKIEEHEINDLLNDDIPYFYRDTTSKSLYTSNDMKIERYFQETVKEALLYRKKQMNDNDLKVQLTLLEMSARISLLSIKDLINDSIELNIPYVEVHLKGGWYEIASRIAKDISSRAIWSESKDKVTWLTMKYIGMNGDNIGIGGCDYYLYDGISGILIFFRMMGLEDESYMSVCNTIETELFAYTDSILSGLCEPVTEYTGALCGEASVALTYQILYSLTKVEKYLCYAAKHIEIVMDLIEKDTKYDFTYGNAGILWVLCNMYELTENQSYIEYAQRVELVLRQYLIKDKNGYFWPISGMDVPYTGVAHGNSGFIWGYVKLCKFNRMKQDYYDILDGLIKYEAFYSNVLNKQNNQNRLESWCHGNLGRIHVILEAVINRVVEANTNEIVKWIDDYIKEIIDKMYLRKSLCLCHGNVGNILIIQMILKLMNWRNDKFACYCQVIRYMLNQEEYGIVTDNYTYGLMSGLSGIGVGCWIMSKLKVDKTK